MKKTINLKENLDVIIITWNRKKYLEKTLDSLLDSPIKACDITIFDNLSTDGTAELIEKYKMSNNNITHIVNRYNVGGNGNIVKAMEYPTKKYFWILCDDDDYDWTNWKEIEKALSEDYDAVVLEWKHEIPKIKNEGFLLNNMGFLPSTIYKTELINETVMYNAYANIMYCFPHLSLFARIVNEKKRVFIASKKIINAGINQHYSVSVDPDIHFRARNFNMFTGLIASAQMIKDKKIRERAQSCLFQGRSLFYSLIMMFKSFNNDKYNLLDIFLSFSYKQKLIMIFSFLSYAIVYFNKSKKGLSVHMFCNTFKIYLWKYKLKK